MDTPFFGFVLLKVLLDGNLRIYSLHDPFAGVFHVEHWVRFTTARRHSGRAP